MTGEEKNAPKWMLAKLVYTLWFVIPWPLDFWQIVVVLFLCSTYAICNIWFADLCVHFLWWPFFPLTFIFFCCPFSQALYHIGEIVDSFTQSINSTEKLPGQKMDEKKNPLRLNRFEIFCCVAICLFRFVIHFSGFDVICDIWPFFFSLHLISLHSLFLSHWLTELMTQWLWYVHFLHHHPLQWITRSILFFHLIFL